MIINHYKALSNQLMPKITCLLYLFIVSQASLAADAPVNKAYTRTELRPFIAIPNPLTMCLRSDAVQKELKLKLPQIIAVNTALDRIELPLWQMRDISNEQRYARATPLLNSLNTELKHILYFHQQQRLHQIIWQQEGISALFNPEMSDTLEISNRQKQDMIAHFEALKLALTQLDRNKNLDLEDRNTARKTITQKTYQNILQVLNDEQQQRFIRLKGEPFDLSSITSVAAKAPPFTGVDAWINSDPLNWNSLKGNVVILHFYTYSCGNSKRNLPHYNDWYTQFADQPVRIIGIHTPEKESEKDIEKVKLKANEANIEYPVAIDNHKRIWNAWANSVWPSIYLVDKNGFIRYWWYGELNWQGAKGDQWILENIRKLLDENASPEKPSLQQSDQTPNTLPPDQQYNNLPQLKSGSPQTTP